MSTAEYVREARRLRSRYAHHPGQLHAALKTLAERHQSEPALKAPSKVRLNTAAPSCRVQVRRVAPTPVSEQPTPQATSFSTQPSKPPVAKTVDTAAVETIEQPATAPVLHIATPLASQFAAEVEARVEAGFLRYSARKQLLARAQGLGIPRFDATLIIASVLHAQTPKSKTLLPDRFPWFLFGFGMFALAILLAR